MGSLGARVKSRDEIHALTLRLTLDDADFPVFDLQLNRSLIVKGTVQHSELSVLARGWASLLESMMRSNEPPSQTPDPVKEGISAGTQVQS